jgi:hypothetical protein
MTAISSNQTIRFSMELMDFSCTMALTQLLLLLSTLLCLIVQCNKPPQFFSYILRIDLSSGSRVDSYFVFTCTDDFGISYGSPYIGFSAFVSSGYNPSFSGDMYTLTTT